MTGMLKSARLKLKKIYTIIQQRSYTTAPVEDYQTVRRNENVHRRKRRQYENNKVQETEYLMNKIKTRKFYKEIN
jgi:hypothetical protein